MWNKIKEHVSSEGIGSIFKYGYRYCLSKATPSIMNIVNRMIPRHSIVFSHFDGKAYGGNPAIICDEIIRKRLPYTLIWIVDSRYKTSLPKGVKYVPVKSLRQVIALARAKVWIDDCRKSSSFRKSASQYYIQTWHGGGPCLKKVEKDAENQLPPTYISDAKQDSSMANLFLSACEWRTNNYRHAFWYNGEINVCSWCSTF